MTYGNEPAFASEAYHPTNGIWVGQSGLTKREYFAAMAMQGLLAAESNDNGYTDTREPVRDDKGRCQRDEAGEIIRNLVRTAAENRAIAAVEQADALIEALNKEVA